jgi:hypothetical protein
LPSDTNDEN